MSVPITCARRLRFLDQARPGEGNRVCSRVGVALLVSACAGWLCLGSSRARQSSAMTYVLGQLLKKRIRFWLRPVSTFALLTGRSAAQDRRPVLELAGAPLRIVASRLTSTLCSLRVFVLGRALALLAFVRRRSSVAAGVCSRARYRPAALPRCVPPTRRSFLLAALGCARTGLLSAC